MAIQAISTNRSHGGEQGVYTHSSALTGTPMTFSVFVPDHAPGTRLPVLWYLSGLTCTHANVTEKGEYRRACAEHGIIFVAPDTSPRGDDVPDDEAYDFGKGAGFYVDATQEPWGRNFRMRSYIERELPELIAAGFRPTWRGRASPAIRWAGTGRLPSACATRAVSVRPAHSRRSSAR
jgi:S-formylglutathione hydrolase